MEVLALLWLPLVLLVGLWPLSGLSRRIDRQGQRLKAIERRMQLITDHLGIAEPALPVPDTVARHLEAGRKIQAIKAYRQATGVSLREAKDAVEALSR